MNNAIIRARAASLKEAGRTQREIAPELGVSRRTVQRWFSPSDYVAHKERHAEYLRTNRAKKKHPRVTYFIADGNGNVKIGSTKNITRRMESFQTANATELSLLGTAETNEGDLHVKFAHYHVRGEWFVLSDEVKSWINEHAEVRDTELSP